MRPQRGRVFAAAVGARGAKRPRPVSTSSDTTGPVDVATDGSGRHIVTWQEGRTAVRAAVTTAAGEFGPPEPVAPCGAIDASGTGPHAAIAQGAEPIVAFRTACGPSLGIGFN
jgi:hypothetical protein